MHPQIITSTHVCKQLHVENAVSQPASYSVNSYAAAKVFYCGCKLCLLHTYTYVYLKVLVLLISLF